MLLKKLYPIVKFRRLSMEVAIDLQRDDDVFRIAALISIIVALCTHRRTREAAWAECSRLDFEREIVIEGLPVRVAGGRSRLLFAKVKDGATAPVVYLAGVGSFARWQRFTVRGRCQSLRRNPGIQRDYIHQSQYPVFYGTIRYCEPRPANGLETILSRAWRLRERFWDFVDERLTAYPRLLAIARATWFADQSIFSESSINTFRGIGISHALALSGQHVAVLALVLSLCARVVIALGLPLGRQIASWIGIIAAVLLCLTSVFTPSVLRVTCVCFLSRILLWANVGLSATRRLAVCLIVLLVLQPRLASNIGFWLSVIGSYFILHKKMRSAFWFNVAVVPLLMIPAQAFFFGTFSAMAPFCGALLAVCWEWVVLPFGFLLPFIPIEVLLQWVDQTASVLLVKYSDYRWDGLVMAAFRPTVLELLGVLLIVFSVIEWRNSRRIQRMIR